MKSFDQYKDILNQPMPIKQSKPDIRTANEKYNYIVESVGGVDNYKRLEKAGINYKELYESNVVQYVKDKANSPEFSDIMSGEISQTVVTGIMTVLITPWVEKKNGIRKYSLLWYMLTYGLIEAIFKLVKQAMDDENDIEICIILASGVVEGVQAWASPKVIKYFLKMFGLTKSNINIFEKNIPINLIVQHARRALVHKVNDSFVEEILCDWSEGSFLGDAFEEIGTVLNDTKNYIMELIN